MPNKKRLSQRCASSDQTLPRITRNGRASLQTSMEDLYLRRLPRFTIFSCNFYLKSTVADTIYEISSHCTCGASQLLDGLPQSHARGAVCRTGKEELCVRGNLGESFPFQSILSLCSLTTCIKLHVGGLPVSPWL